MVDINKLKEIYIVTAGEYSDYHIVEVFSNFDEAEKFAELHGGGGGNIVMIIISRDI